MIQQIIFALVSVAALAYGYKQFMRIKRIINLGQDEATTGDTSQRWSNVLRIAFGQKKMFKRFIPAILHLFIYVAFLFTQIELIEIFIDGLFGIHRFFAPYLGMFYTFIISFIEILSVGAFISTIVFLSRRNILKIPRFHMDEMTGWPKLDGNLILLFELLLLVGIFSMNGADMVLQKMGAHHYTHTGHFAVSSWFGPTFFGGLSESTLMVIERFGWWLHILIVFVFLNYLPKSKHLHVFFAFPNTYFAKLTPYGKMDNMEEIMNEVKSMMDPDAAFDDVPMDEELPDFGSNDVFTLSWKDILAAYTCTECGRCSSECPANITGKKLSPRKVMMDVRDRAEEIYSNIEKNNTDCIKDGDSSGKLTKDNYDDGKSLFDYISREEIHACTTCNACIEACPVLIRPVDIILKLRRYEILTESAGPSDWIPMFTSIENSGSVWQVPDSREDWINEQ